MSQHFEGAIFLQEPRYYNPMEYRIQVLTEADFAELANRENQYRLLGFVRCSQEIDLTAEWAQFCSMVGLRLKPENNFPDGESASTCFEQWIREKGGEWFEPTEPQQAARLPHVYLDYID